MVQSLVPVLLAVLPKHAESFNMAYVGLSNKYWVRMCNNLIYTCNRTREAVNCINVPDTVVFYQQVYLL